MTSLIEDAAVRQTECLLSISVGLQVDSTAGRVFTAEMYECTSTLRIEVDNLLMNTNKL